MSEASSPRKSFTGSLVFLLFVVAGSLVGFLFRQNIVDAYWVWQYKPTAAVATIRSDLGLTSDGTYVFNASRPELESSQTFNKSCDQQTETNNPILGCYVHQNIYIYDVTNKKLSGIEETTAAHELLHAAYERMGSDEKKKVDALVLAAYQKVKTPELEQRMAYYHKSEPGEEANELHSILGTEFSNLGSELEAHYHKYFTDRNTLLRYYKTYSSVFTSVTERLKSLNTQINDLSSKINGQISDYNAETTALNADIKTFENTTFTSQSELDSQRSSLIARQNELKQLREVILAEIDQVDNLKNQYNALVDQYNELNRSINSSLSPTPTF